MLLRALRVVFGFQFSGTKHGHSGGVVPGALAILEVKSDDEHLFSFYGWLQGNGSLSCV